ncbi:MAG: membrane protein of unknown function [Promethearchaeota archaeon]|nr:MAG: membrane protein of unknown function [Candidatus Lokiarchaeota archaeon]
MFFFGAYLTTLIAVKARQGNLLSTTTGFAVYMGFYCLYVFASTLPFLYLSEIDTIDFNLYQFIFTIFYFLGIIFFVFLTEFDNKKHGEVPAKKPIPYLLTIMALIGLILFLIFGIFKIYDWFITLFILLIPFIFASKEILTNFENLKIVQNFKMNLFYSGLVIAGTSNGLISFIFLFGIEFLVLKDITIIIGSLLMVYTWKSLPPLSELNWIDKMQQLLVVHSETSALLFNYHFKMLEDSEERGLDSDLAGSAIEGIGMLLLEILADTGHLKVIDHGNKKIYFVHGRKSTSILISTGTLTEFQYRLEMFHIRFEKYFDAELSKFLGDISSFKNTESIVREVFIS